MSRIMNKDDCAFRIHVVVTLDNGDVNDIYHGPYGTLGAARSQRTTIVKDWNASIERSTPRSRTYPLPVAVRAVVQRADGWSPVG